MGFGLSINLGQRTEIRQEQKLELRLGLEQCLEQKLQHQLKHEIRLGQYLYQEDIIKGFIRWANEHNAWKEFKKNGFQFTYAALPYRLAAPIADEYGPGFSHCMYNIFEGRAQGDWTLFVVPELLSSDLVELVAIHERGEELSLGNHYFASQLEFAYAKKNGNVRKYCTFIDEQYPHKFVDLTQKVHFPVLPQELVEFLTERGKRNAEELSRAEELIRKYPISNEVLRLMIKYEHATAHVCDEISKLTGQAQATLFQTFKTGFVRPEQAMEIVDALLRKFLGGLEAEQVRGISLKRVSEYWNSFCSLVGNDVFKASYRNLEIPETFMVAYHTARKDKPVVSVKWTPEDKAKELA